MFYILLLVNLIQYLYDKHCFIQGIAFSTIAEQEIINAVFENRGLTKVSINLRLPEGRHKIEQTTIRNLEIRKLIYFFIYLHYILF